MATGLYGTKSSGNSGMIGNHSPHAVVEQSIITANYGVPVDLPKYRSKDSSTRHIGHYRNDHELTVMPGEFFFIDKFDSFGSSTASFSANGFTGFNGLEIPDGVYTDDDFAQRFIFAGVTNGSVYVDGRTGVTTKSGVAVKRQGSGTLNENYGSSTFHPGDKIKLVLPSIDASKRLQQLNQRRVNKKHQGTGPGLSKIVPIPTVAHPTDIVNTFRGQALSLLSAHPRDYDIEQNQFNIGVRGISGGKLSTKDQQTLYLKQFISAISYSAIAQAAQSGYVLINPTAHQASYNPTAYQRFSSNKKDVNTSKPHESHFDPTSGVRTAANQAQQNEYKKNMDNFCRLLSTSLGLTRDMTQAWLTEDRVFSDAIRYRILGAASGDGSAHQRLQKLYLTNDFSKTAGTNQGVFGTSYGTGSIKDKTIKRIIGTADQYYRSCGSTYDSEMKLVIADASNVSGPGQVLHYVMT